MVLILAIGNGRLGPIEYTLAAAAFRERQEGDAAGGDQCQHEVEERATGLTEAAARDS